MSGCAEELLVIDAEEMCCDGPGDIVDVDVLVVGDVGSGMV